MRLCVYTYTLCFEMIYNEGEQFCGSGWILKWNGGETSGMRTVVRLALYVVDGLFPQQHSAGYAQVPFKFPRCFLVISIIVDSDSDWLLQKNHLASIHVCYLPLQQNLSCANNPPVHNIILGNSNYVWMQMLESGWIKCIEYCPLV